MDGVVLRVACCMLHVCALHAARCKLLTARHLSPLVSSPSRLSLSRVLPVAVGSTFAPGPAGSPSEGSAQAEVGVGVGMDVCV